MHTVEEIAQRLRVNRATVYRLLRSKALNAQRDEHGRWWIDDHADHLIELAEKNRLLSAKEVAGRLGIHVNIVRELIRDGHLVGYRIGRPDGHGHYRISAQAIVDYLDRARAARGDHTVGDDDDPPRGPVPVVPLGDEDEVLA